MFCEARPTRVLTGIVQGEEGNTCCRKSSIFSSLASTDSISTAPCFTSIFFFYILFHSMRDVFRKILSTCQEFEPSLRTCSGRREGLRRSTHYLFSLILSEGYPDGCRMVCHRDHCRMYNTVVSKTPIEERLNYIKRGNTLRDEANARNLVALQPFEVASLRIHLYQFTTELVMVVKDTTSHTYDSLFTLPPKFLRLPHLQTSSSSTIEDFPHTPRQERQRRTVARIGVDLDCSTGIFLKSGR